MKKKIKYKDFPFDEIIEAAKKFAEDGLNVHQKFTCTKCGSRQTIDTPNAFHTHGRCEECDHVTDIVASGCNYMLVGRSDILLKTMLKK
jgi:transcription initiation factor IIE alpha subunit